MGTCWLPDIRAGTIANNNIILFYSTKNQVYNVCDVFDSVLSYISGLCTAAVEQQELHEDNTFTLNSEILSRQSM